MSDCMTEFSLSVHFIKAFRYSHDLNNFFFRFVHSIYVYIYLCIQIYYSYRLNFAAAKVHGQ